MALSDYFQNNDLTQKALEGYSSFVSRIGWPVQAKLHLYRLAKQVFESADANEKKKENFKTIYDDLKANYNVFLDTSRERAKHWHWERVFQTFTTECLPCARPSRITLMSDLENPSNLVPLMDHLKRLVGIKEKNAYPIMVVSKFSHFFNPSLFPIYDTKVIENMVMEGQFIEDWTSFRLASSVGTDETSSFPGLWYALHYILWASHMIRNSGRNLMGTFADWFTKQVGNDHGVEDMRLDLSGYYATAFEFIAIGAMEVERQKGL